MKRLFCRLFHHKNLMHPIHQSVTCRKCQCRWPVKWEVKA